MKPAASRGQSGVVRSPSHASLGSHDWEVGLPMELILKRPSAGFKNVYSRSFSISPLLGEPARGSENTEGVEQQSPEPGPWGVGGWGGKERRGGRGTRLLSTPPPPPRHLPGVRLQIAQKVLFWKAVKADFPALPSVTLTSPEQPRALAPPARSPLRAALAQPQQPASALRWGCLPPTPPPPRPIEFECMEEKYVSLNVLSPAVQCLRGSQHWEGDGAVGESSRQPLLNLPGN